MRPMKQRFLLIFSISLLLVGNLKAQDLLNRTLRETHWIKVTSREDPVSLRFTDGSTFVGTRKTFFSDGVVSSVYHFGTYTAPTGERYITPQSVYGFDQNFRVKEGYIWRIDTNGDRYAMHYRNYECVNSYLDSRPYTIVNNCLVRTSSSSDSYSSGTYDGGSYNSGSTSGSSNYDRHKATCSGCNGLGTCRLCGGRGMVNNNKSTCSRCHGTGRCISCHGNGFIRGNF